MLSYWEWVLLALEPGQDAGAPEKGGLSGSRLSIRAFPSGAGRSERVPSFALRPGNVERDVGETHRC